MNRHSTAVGVNRFHRRLALFLLCAAFIAARPPGAHAQSGPICLPGIGCFLLVPADMVDSILRLNLQGSVNVVSNVQVGEHNLALIQVEQGNLAVPADAVPGLLQLNVTVINNVQIGNNNVAIISAGEGNGGTADTGGSDGESDPAEGDETDSTDDTTDGDTSTAETGSDASDESCDE